VTRREALARHPVAIIGALLTTASAVVFIALLIAMLLGMLSNPYAGLVVFVAIPAVFVLGLLLIPLGMRLQKRKLARHPDAVVDDWPVLDFRLASVRRTALLITALTAVNIVIILLAGYGSLHYMETPAFCGQACHTPMQPQFTALQNAAHGQVACVNCHIGEGVTGFAHAKLSGVRQLMMMPASSYPRPIPPGANMQPGAQAMTCANCHQPGRVVGDRVRVIREYADDEQNSETMTVLQMHLSASTSSQRAIHWHADPAVRVEYVSTDPERQTIPYVKVTDAKGQVKEFVAPDTTEEAISTGNRQTMDCIDCHNTVGHPISPTAERAVDRAIAAAMISRELPFARREGLKLVKAEYGSQDDAVRAIERGLRSFYDSRGAATDQQALARTVAAFQDVYRRNVFPTMKVTWGTYPDNKGHFTSTGCFRCHDDSHKAKDGSTISADCEFCHKQIERP
jgi:NapC/NirT cytochrome c family, N-terminal region